MIFRHIFSVGSMTLVSRFLGFLRDVAQAAFLGASPLMDAVAIAIKVPSLFRKLFAEGAFNASFVPAFSRLYQDKGKEEAQKFAGQIFTLLLGVVIVVIVVSEILMPQVVPLIAPGLQKGSERLHYAIMFSRITFPFLLMISLNAFFSGILNSLDRFWAAAFSPAAGNIGILGVLWFFHDKLSTPAHALVWGVFVCGVVQASWVAWATYRAHFRLQWGAISMSSDMKKFLKAFLPGIWGSGVAQLNLFFDMVLGSFLPVGGISYLYYADRLYLLPLSVIGTAIGTALLPTLSRSIQAQEYDHIRDTLRSTIRYGLTISLPCAIVLIILAEPVIHVLFERQAFDATSTYETARALCAFSWGLPSYVLVKIFTTIAFAHRDTKMPMILGIGSIICNVVISLVLMPIFAHQGLAMATALTSWGHMLSLWVILRRRGWLEPGLLWHKKMFVIAQGALLMALFFLFVSQNVLSVLKAQDHLVLKGLILGGVAVLGMGGFVGFGWIRGGFERTLPQAKE